MSTNQPGWVDPAAPGANVGQRGRLANEAQLGSVERAAIRFNESEAVRTVGGLTRTLGEPWVSIGAAAGSSSEARITVAWELCWYQWGVDLADDRRSVFSIGKGSEIEQLDGSARQWNASADAAGHLAPGKQAAACGGESVR